MKCRKYRAYVNHTVPYRELETGDSSWLRRLPSPYRTHWESCPGCRAFSAALGYAAHPEALHRSPPEDLAARVARTARRTQVEDSPATDRSRPTLRRLLEGLASTPRLLRWAGMAAAAIALIVITAALTLQFAGGGRDTVVVHLHIQAPGAQQVSVVGDWNEWQPQANPLTDRDGDGVWETRIEVPGEGEYQYQFLINGEKWIPDPNAPLQVDDGFGGTNSVLDI